MVTIEKLYFPLRQVAERWRVPMDDLVYAAETGELRTSIRVDRVCIEQGILEVDGDQQFRCPYDRSWYTGLLDLTARDAFLVFRDGYAEVRDFRTDVCNEYLCVIHPSMTIPVTPAHLVMRREERDRIEARHREARGTVAKPACFQHSQDYRNVCLGGVELVLGAVQANVIRILHQAALDGRPWCAGKAVLAAAGATSQRMTDVFKSQPHWRQLIRSDGRGRYMLRLEPE
jgi:hypothetical protein